MRNSLAALVEFIELGDVGGVKSLLQADPALLEKGHPSEYARTPLAIAVSYNRDEIVKTLVELGANLNTPDDFGDRPLDLAFDKKMMDYLLQHGANIKAKNNLGFTLLHRFNCPEIDRFLVSKGLDPNARANDWQTPIHMACLRGEPVSRIKGLVELGANIWLKDKFGSHIYNYLEDFLSSTDGQREGGQKRALEIESYFDTLV